MTRAGPVGNGRRTGREPPPGRAASAPSAAARPSAFTVASRRTDPPGTVGARAHHHGVSDDEPTLTVRDRLTAAGLSAERIEQHLTAGRLRVDGELVDDLDTPAPVGTRVVVWTE